MKKLLIMGSNFGSVALVREAKKRGYYTIVTDYYGAEHSAAKRECDECWDISTDATQALAKKCEEQHVDAAACGVSEFNSEMTLRLCMVAGLPMYCTWDAWEFTCDKRRFKDACINNGVRVADDYDISALDNGDDIDGIRFPVVVKPIDGAANVGVSFCYSYEELLPAYKYAKDVTKQKDTIICEKMIVGPEYAAMYALRDGEARLLSTFAMLNDEDMPSNIYSLDITKTGITEKYVTEIDSGIRSLFKKSGYTDGIVWIEVMHNLEDDKLYVLEAGYRFPASMIQTTYKKLIGFDAISWYLDGFTGVKHYENDMPKHHVEEHDRYGVSYLLWNKEGGVIETIEGMDKIAADKRIDVVECLRWPGYELKPNTLMAEIIFTTDSREKLIEIIRHINDNVKVRVKGGKDVLIRYNSFDKIL